MMKIILCVALAMLVWILGYYLHFLPLPKPQIYQYITLFLITVAQPTAIYLTIKRNYESSNHLKEPLQLEFTTEDVKMQGESFYTQIAWKKVFKVEELKNWYMIYQNNLSAIIIPKSAFHGRQKEEFELILKGISSVPVHLKK